MSEQQLGEGAIRSVAELAKAAQVSDIRVIHPVPGEPPNVYLIHNLRTGLTTRHVAELKPHSYTLYSTAAVAAFVKENGGKVLLSPNDIVVVSSRATRQTPPTDGAAEDSRWEFLATMDLTLQPAYVALGQMSGQKHQQRPFWNTLRTRFKNAIGVDDIAIFKTVRWTDGADEQRSVGVAKESLGKSYTGDVTGEGAIPEELTFRVGVYDTAETRLLSYPVLCAVDTIKEEKSFRLMPVDNAMEYARENALNDIKARLITELQAVGLDPKMIVFGSLCDEV